jgi:AraC-like DNA-binding protein
MILRRHVPAPPLDAFVHFFWHFEAWDGSHPMEHVLPDGTFELVINLLDGPRKLFNRHDLGKYTAYRGGWLSGAHSQYIVIDTQKGASMMGAHFRPGGATPFLSAPAEEFQDQVVELEAIWGHSARLLREELLAAGTPSARFQVLERSLLAWLRRWNAGRPFQARMDSVIGGFCRQPDVAAIGAVAETLGISHRHFIRQFRDQVGLTPKLFCRIRRFQQVLARIHSRGVVNWAEIACACGYYDQSHFVKDFYAFAGLNPSQYHIADDEDSASFVPIDKHR